MADDSEQERWSDEELAETLDDIAYQLVEPDQPVLREAARRLRGGEGERLRRAAREVARMRRSTSNSLAGGMCEALDELSEALGPVVTAEQAEQVHEGHSAAVCPDCGRQEGDLHHPACPLADGDALSPTDGEEGLGYGCRICERPTDGVTICRYCDRMMQAAAPDTEGEEKATNA